MNHRPAFTLLEMLMATVLTVVLMVGVIAVVARLGAPGGKPASTVAPTNETIQALVRLLREDIAAAGVIDVSNENALTLVGYDALDARRRERTDRPVRVVYTLEQIGGYPWLVRRQAAMDVMTNQNVQRDLVCGGATRFELLRAADATGSAARERGPATWRLRVWTADRPEPAYDGNVAVRAGDHS